MNGAQLIYIKRTNLKLYIIFCVYLYKMVKIVELFKGWKIKNVHLIIFPEKSLLLLYCSVAIAELYKVYRKYRNGKSSKRN